MAEALDDAATAGVWRAAEAAQVPLMMLLPQARMPVVAAIAERHPRLSIVLDHLGVPSSVPPSQRFEHLDRLLALARFPNVAVKASALPCIADDAYPYRSLHAPLRRVVDAFGARRVFWGSDFSRLPCSYRECVAMFMHEMPWLSADELTWIMGRGIVEWLGLEPFRARGPGLQERAPPV
jgi:L-fuconolactonase